MAWGIHYRLRGAAGYRSLGVFAMAIREACELLGQGADVGEVSNSDGSKTIGADEIRRICADERARRPNEIIGNANPRRATQPISVARLWARKEHHDRRAKDGQNEELGKSGMSAAGRDVVCGLCCALDHLWPRYLRIDHAFHRAHLTPGASARKPSENT
jgi:hypothetical protein